MISKYQLQELNTENKQERSAAEKSTIITDLRLIMVFLSLLSYYNKLL